MRHRRIGYIALLLLFVIATLIAFLRNPLALSDPTMFTEDGSWSAMLYTHGPLVTYLEARSDYLVVANIALLHLATAISEVIGTGLIGTPPVIAVLSYLFYGAVATFAAVALRDHLPLWARTMIVILIAAVPVGHPQSAAEIWGRASNIGFAFAFIAPLAMIWRESAIEKGRRLMRFAAEGVIVLSCATNPIGIPLVFAYLGARLLRERSRETWRRDLPLIVMIVVLSAFMAFGVHSTVRPQEEIAAERTWQGALLSGVARPLLYPFVFPVYNNLNNAWAIGLAAVLFSVLAYALALARQKAAFAFFLSCMLLVTVAIAIQRPLLPTQMGGYTGTYPDRYFYAQNVMVIAAVVWALAIIRERFREHLWSAGPPIAFTLLFAFNLPTIFISTQVTCAPAGTDFGDQVTAALVIESRPEVVSVEICPPTWFIEFPASEVPGRSESK
ncbi:hypothetical protein [Pelagibacterium luteolum]|uniref:Glucosyl transferase GtrII n=1 Tax=Pelagibacterium luteolum TaxID=440168 RepID=A0A1G7XVV0_9HYPH|nr:hypothetical protein [Pelagibacterium luteolum]SDG88322.1 hypothetical protein SAMN04487974_11133 [Pelagibacterium luteolum]